jgi:hypothetical protein
MSWPADEMFGGGDQKLEFLAGDHSASWLNAREFHTAFELARKEVPDGKYTPDEWDVLDNLLGVLASIYGERRVRVVFNFDN